MHRATSDRTVVVKGINNKAKHVPTVVTAPVLELPRASDLEHTQPFTILRQKNPKAIDLPDAELASNEQLFVAKTLPQGELSFVSGEKEEAPVCIFVRGDKQVTVSTSKTEAAMYVAGDISSLAWANFEAFARGTWRMLATALKIGLNEISFSHGVLIGDGKFCLAAKFELKRCLADSLRSEPTQKRIETGTGLMGCLDLWKDTEVKLAYPNPEDADLIQAARDARQEISTKELPFSCVLECDAWPNPIQIQKVLAPRNPPTESTITRCEKGKSTGYCTHNRRFHFKVLNTNSLENISFDEQEYFDEILDVSGKMTPMIEVTWTEQRQDKSIIASTLKKITRVTDVLC